MFRLFIASLLLLLGTSLYAANNSPKIEQGTAASEEQNVYQSYLTDTQSMINKRFPDFFSELTQSEQLIWIDYVGRQAAEFGYDNVSLRQSFTFIACYLGKDFMTDDKVYKNIKRFLQDERFSKYVRVRDIRRYLKRKKYQLTKPTVAGIN